MLVISLDKNVKGLTHLCNLVLYTTIIFRMRPKYHFNNIVWGKIFVAFEGHNNLLVLATFQIPVASSFYLYFVINFVQNRHWIGF